MFQAFIDWTWRVNDWLSASLGDRRAIRATEALLGWLAWALLGWSVVTLLTMLISGSDAAAAAGPVIIGPIFGVAVLRQLYHKIRTKRLRESD